MIITVLVLRQAFAGGSLTAQAGEAYDDPAPIWEIGPYVGGARHSPVGTWFGVVPDRDHLFLGVHATATMWRWRAWSLAYAPDIVPLLLVSNNPNYRSINPDTATRPVRVDDGTRGPVFGFGIAPIGLETHVRFASRWRGYGAGAVGVVWFTREVPLVEARAFNYTLEFGGGLQWQYRPGRWLRVGYKFHHLSNNYTAPSNPGIDAHVFLLGLDHAIGARR